jgi:hypothetical protein
MADFGGSPVGTEVNPVGQGFTTLNNLMNLRRSQQALQIGQQELQSRTAEAQQAQQKNQELQSLAQFTKSAAQNPAYHNPDGSLNVQKYQTDAMAAAPTYGQAYIGQMTANANAMVDNRKALLGLSNEQRSTIGNYFGAVAAKPNATKDDFAEAAEQARGVSDDPAYQKAVDRMLMATPDVRTMPTEQASAAIRQHARGIAMETNAPGANASNPAVSMVQGPGGLVPTNVNPQAPGGVQSVGPPQAQGIAPQIIQQPGTQNPAVVGPGTAVRPIGASGAPGTPNPWQLPVGGAQNMQGMAEDDRGRYAQISQEGTNARTGAVLADQVAQLADQVRTGKLSKEWTDRLTVLQQHDPNLTARQMLSKYAAQLKTMATQGATTDASRSQIDEGMPSPETMGPDAVKEAAQYVGGIFRMRGARQAYADQYTKNAGSSLGIRNADDAFMRAADPTVFTYNALKPGVERQQFLKSRFGNDPEKLRDFSAHINQVKHYAGSIE